MACCLNGIETLQINSKVLEATAETESVCRRVKRIEEVDNCIILTNEDALNTANECLSQTRAIMHCVGTRTATREQRIGR